MVDSISSARRSENMRRIKSKGMKPEIAVHQAVHRMGYRFRLHVAGLPGRPDMVFPRLGKIIEVRGCFWHQHPGCIDASTPKTRPEYWGPKLAKNQERDKRNGKELRRMGWKILCIWECDVNDKRTAERIT